MTKQRYCKDGKYMYKILEEIVQATTNDIIHITTVEDKELNAGIITMTYSRGCVKLKEQKAISLIDARDAEYITNILQLYLADFIHTILNTTYEIIEELSSIEINKESKE